MAYVAVRGGENAIAESIRSLEFERLKDGHVLDVVAIQAGMKGLIDQVMSESSLYDREPDDITKVSLSFPTSRSERLQSLTRGQTGAVTSFGYSSLCGYGMTHPTVGELRVGLLPIEIASPFAGETDEDDSYYIGEVEITEVETLVPISKKLPDGRSEEHFEVGYGICYGQNETKAIAMSILDRTLETEGDAPANSDEFVLYHIDSVESSGFISHLKLPHYVTFQAELDAVRKTKKS